MKNNKTYISFQVTKRKIHKQKTKCHCCTIVGNVKSSTKNHCFQNAFGGSISNTNIRKMSSKDLKMVWR